MPRGRVPAAEDQRRQDAVRAAYEKHGHNVSAISRETGMHRQNVRKRLSRLGLYGKPLTSGAVRAPKRNTVALPKAGEVRRFILTAAQNNTPIFKQFFKNLQVFAEHVGAVLHVSRFTYNKNAYGRMSVKPTTEETQDDLWYDPAIAPYVSDTRLALAPGLDWCGELNILPTVVNPLSGLESYTGRHSSVIPHSKIALQSVASGKHEATKFLYTTGAVTQRNYIQKTAGQKAEFHHAYGALLVEVDSSGSWFCRHLNADSTGTFYDLDVRVRRGKITTGHRVEAINWGDIHVAEIDPAVRSLAWGAGGMLDILQPKYQVMHDVLDFMARSHWDDKDPHVRFKIHVAGEDNIEREVIDVGEFLKESKRKNTLTVVVDSNHHNHLGRWLKEKNGLYDPVNADFWARLNARVLQHIRKGRGEPDYLSLALLETIEWDSLKDVRVLHEDESFIICPDANAGIELGMHGDRGLNGARGSPRSFARMGRKANTGHTHSAGIFQGIYTAGTCSSLTPDWVHGPSSWSHSHIVTYPNGKRTIVTMWMGKWRA
jgi:transposase-like protein